MEHRVDSQSSVFEPAGVFPAGLGRAVARALCSACLCVLAACLVHAVPAFAQQAPARTAPAPQGGAGWQADIDVKKTAPGAPKSAKPAKPSNTTVIERDGVGPGQGQIKLVALLTADGQEIDQGLIWRVYQAAGGPDTKSKLVTENRDASPALKLQPGEYTVNAAFGRANLTRKISIKPGASGTEKFVLNAGGMRLTASVAGKPVAEGALTYAIYSDDRDQFANRTAVMTGAKPGLIIRLNAGIYHLVSTYGDANAKVEADVTVEAGKLTEATVTHQAAKAAFKLVTRAGGEALPDTHWTIQAQNGEVVKETVGALPSHILAPGSYTVLAKSAGRVFQRAFSVKEGETVSVEVLAEGGEAPPAAAAPVADGENFEMPELKNP